jgi:D-sedoheptulose 7-phosphate isomerase
MKASPTPPDPTPLERAIGESSAMLAELADREAELRQAAELLFNCLTAGHKLMVCGNGGSASDATHLATEFACRFMEDRRPYPALSLTANGELMTAIGNDYRFDEVFARQVRAFGQPGDVLIALTTSGRSNNVRRALEQAKAMGLQSVCFFGRDGGFTKGLATVELSAPGSNTARIQEAQKLLYHVLCEMVDARLPKE